MSSPAPSLAGAAESGLDRDEQRRLVQDLQSRQSIAKSKDQFHEDLRSSGRKDASKKTLHAGTIDLGHASQFATVHDLVDKQFKPKPATEDEQDRRKSLMKGNMTASLGDVARVSHPMFEDDAMQIQADLAKASAVAKLKLLRRATAQFHGTLSEEELSSSLLQGEEDVKGASSFEVAIMVANLIVGNGLLTMPYGFVLAGWAAVPVIIVTSGALVVTGSLLGKAFGEMVRREVPDPNFGDISEAAFGAWSRPLFDMFCLGECVFMGIFFNVFIGNALAPVFKCNPDVIIYACAAIGWLLYLVPRRIFALLSMIGLGLTFFALAAVMVTGISLLPAWSDTQVTLTSNVASGSVAMSAFAALASGDHAVFGGIYAVSKDEASFCTGLLWGYVVFTVLAIIFGSVCYSTFGTSVMPVSLNNIGRDLTLEVIPGWGWLFAVGNVCLAARALLTAPAFSKPVVNYFAQLLQRLTGQELSVPADMESELSLLGEDSKKFALRMTLIAALMLTYAVGSDVLSDLLAALETLTSAFFKTVNCFWLPGFGVLKLCAPGRAKSLAILVLMVLAGLWGMKGTADAVSQIASGKAA